MNEAAHEWRRRCAQSAGIPHPTRRPPPAYAPGSDHNSRAMAVICVYVLSRAHSQHQIANMTKQTSALPGLKKKVASVTWSCQQTLKGFHLLGGIPSPKAAGAALHTLACSPLARPAILCVLRWFRTGISLSQCSCPGSPASPPPFACSSCLPAYLINFPLLWSSPGTHQARLTFGRLTSASPSSIVYWAHLD